MPRFSQRRKSKRRMTRSKRGGAINIPDTGLTDPISIYYLNPKYNDDPNNKIKKYTLNTLKPIQGKSVLCQIIVTLLEKMLCLKKNILKEMKNIEKIY